MRSDPKQRVARCIEVTERLRTTASHQLVEATNRSRTSDLGGGGLGSLLESVGETTLSASLSVLVPSHEDTSSALRSRAWGLAFARSE